MAVQAQYPANASLFNRSEHERKGMDCSQQPPGYLEQQSPFCSNGVNVINQRKRARDVFQTIPTPQMSTNILMINSYQNHALVSTGLKLSFEDNNNQSQTHLQKDLHSLITQQDIEIEQYLVTQAEQLRRTLAERTNQHYRALLSAVEEKAARRIYEKDLELNRAMKKLAELENRIATLRTELLTWQTKALSEQATVTSLNAQIQQANNINNNYSRLEVCATGSDAESAYVDPNRVEDPKRTCRVCRVSEVSVVLLPCRHLCICFECDAAVTETDGVCCPVCHVGRTGSVQVFLS